VLLLFSNTVCHIWSQIEYNLFGKLGHCARTGDTAWSTMYKKDDKGADLGGHGGDMFDNTYKDKEFTARFMKTMNSIASQEAPGVMSAYDLSKYGTIVDIGGAGGTLMVAACKLYPNATTIVLDLPPVVEIANEQFSKAPYITDDSIRSRISWTSGDIFGDPMTMPEGDLYVLSHILHDWNDASCKTILDNVFHRIKAGGAILVSEALLNETVGPMIGHIMDTIMLVRGEGKERTFKHFVTMLESAGFVDVSFKGPFFNSNTIMAYKPLA
jgi:hypothetical protein